MHFILVVFPCDVILSITDLQQPRRTIAKRKGTETLSVLVASSLMAGHGQFLLVKDWEYFQLFLGLKEFVASKLSFAKFVNSVCHAFATFTK